MHFHVLQIMNHCADLLANGCAARFTRREYNMPFGTQVFHERRNVRCLARTFRTFESDEHTESIQVDRYKCKQVNKHVATCLPVYLCTCLRFYSLKILTCRLGSLPYE